MSRKKAPKVLGRLSRRERQIMPIVSARDGANSRALDENMADAASYPDVRGAALPNSRELKISDEELRQLRELIASKQKKLL